jgi:hypothetical protein
MLLVISPALAQQVDQCTLTPGPNPLATVLQKLECRLQVEDNTRMAAEENLIIAQADQKIAEGKVARLGDQLDDANKKLAWWKDYDKGVSKLFHDVKVACSSRSLVGRTLDRPIEEMCRKWRH